MRNRESIQDVRQKIDLYFDNALPPKDKEELMFRDFIKNNVKRTSVSPDMIQSIRDSIRKR